MPRATNREPQITNTSPLRWRGIVEGFYFKPWSHAGRLRSLAFMREAGFDSYIYAPKADPFHRDRWREAYPAPDRRRFRELLSASAANGVEFFWAVSPGLTIRYSEREDFDALLSRMLEMAELGVKSFGLFLDDISEKLSDTDRAFGSLAHAQVDVTNRIYDELRARAEVKSFLFCPTEYWWVKPTPHLEIIGAGLDSGVGVFWTGEYVVSPSVTGEQARSVAKTLRRRPVLWDNYPVNDYNRRKLHLGPLMGRDASLVDHLDGYFANPMNEEMCSRAALLTISDYLRDPAGYDSEASLEKALRRTAGKGGAALRRVADVLRPGIFPGEPVPAVVSAIKEFESAENPASIEKNGKKLLKELSSLREAAEKLPGLVDRIMAAELRPHMRQIGFATLAADRAVRFRLSGEIEKKKLKKDCAKYLRRARAAGRVVHAGAIEAFAERANTMLRSYDN